MGNGNSPEKELQTSVLGCVNKIICSLDKSLFHAAVNLIQCNMCGCIWKIEGNLDCNTHFISRVSLNMGLRTLQAMQKIYLTTSAVLNNFLTKPSAMFY